MSETATMKYAHSGESLCAPVICVMFMPKMLWVDVS
jgi:hypothetical protein